MAQLGNEQLPLMFISVREFLVGALGVDGGEGEAQIALRLKWEIRIGRTVKN